MNPFKTKKTLFIVISIALLIPAFTLVIFLTTKQKADEQVADNSSEQTLGTIDLGDENIDSIELGEENIQTIDLAGAERSEGELYRVNVGGERYFYGRAKIIDDLYISMTQPTYYVEGDMIGIIGELGSPEQEMFINRTLISDASVMSNLDEDYKDYSSALKELPKYKVKEKTDKQISEFLKNGQYQYIYLGNGTVVYAKIKAFKDNTFEAKGNIYTIVPSEGEDGETQNTLTPLNEESIARVKSLPIYYWMNLRPGNQVQQALEKETGL